MRNGAQPAKDLNLSSQIREQINLIDIIGATWLITSPKHEFTSKNTIADKNEIFSRENSSDLKSEIMAQYKALNNAKSENSSFKRIIILPAEGRELNIYKDLKASINSEILIAQREFNFKIKEKALSIQKNISRIKETYEIVTGNFSSLYDFDAFSEIEIPQQGVYFFFDREERSNVIKDHPKIVRIGTHGVSAGSKATLRQRLRAHFGTKNGAGNHRSSVFRLHVGECIIKKYCLQDLYPHWGKGSISEKSVIQSEVDLELKVSEYIRNLHLGWIKVDGLSEKNNTRAALEKELIQSLTQYNIAIEQSTSDWLGTFSSRPSIRHSGLWNVQHSGHPISRKTEMNNEQFTLFT
jgi:hypothetical protein